METFEDLLAANSTFIDHTTIVADKQADDSDSYQTLMKKAIHFTKSFDECARILIEHRNVSCTGREHLALLMIKKYGIAHSQSRMYILKQIIGVWTGGIYHAGGSPYKSRFQKITCALLESGISGRWDAAYIPKAENPKSQIEEFKQETSLTNKSLNLMITVLLVGHSCSFLLFVAELFISKNFDVRVLSA